MIHKDLCNPDYTKNWTALRIQFNFLLSSIHRNGEIPLSMNEIAQRLNCHVDSIRRCSAEAEYDGTIRREGDKIFFTKCVEEGDSYVKHFPFLDTEAFRGEDIQVIRFVLFALFRGVYAETRAINQSLQKFYHKLDKQKNIVEEGLFNIYHAGKMRDVIEKSSKYLVFSQAPIHVVRVIGLREEYTYPEPVKNQGELLMFRKTLAKYGLEDATSEAIEELVKIKSRYKKNIGIEAANEIVDEALVRSLNRQDSVLVSLIIRNDLRSIGNYFSTVCQDVEQEYASRLQHRKEQLERSHRFNQAYHFMKGNILAKIKGCANFFKEQIDLSLEKVKEEIAAFDRYWFNIAVQLKGDPKKQEQFIHKKNTHPLIQQLPMFQKIIEILNETIRSRQEIISRPFPFYNWLEPDTE